MPIGLAEAEARTDAGQDIGQGARKGNGSNSLPSAAAQAADAQFQHLGHELNTKHGVLEDDEEDRVPDKENRQRAADTKPPDDQG